jgi:hypothetical protein
MNAIAFTSTFHGDFHFDPGPEYITVTTNVSRDGERFLIAVPPPQLRSLAAEGKSRVRRELLLNAVKLRAAEVL